MIFQVQGLTTEFDVGLVKSARPVRVKLDPGEALPNRQQYPLKPGADEGISKTIYGVIKAGVLMETQPVQHSYISGVKGR